MIKIGVSSNIKFYKTSLPILLPSLIESGIHHDDIHVFIGGYDEYHKEINEGIHYHFVNHNSLDNTALIEICDKEIESEYWFIIHDTCKVGDNFKTLLYNIPEDKPDKIALRNCPSMCIGTYSYKFLMSNKERIMSIKNTDYSIEGIKNVKLWAINNEDYLLWKTNPLPIVYNNIHNWEIKDYINWYGTDTIRRTEYYPSLDLYKNKSNWGQGDGTVLNI